jgi:hypothetical protein
MSSGWSQSSLAVNQKSLPRGCAAGFYDGATANSGAITPWPAPGEGEQSTHEAEERNISCFGVSTHIRSQPSRNEMILQVSYANAQEVAYQFKAGSPASKN